jgi:hypothetical protein
MTAYECYQQYLSLKNHFTKQNYDYFKYNGKVKTNLSSFSKRKDKIFFEKMAKHADVYGFLVANLSNNPKTWIKELAYSEEAENVYKEWHKKQQSLSYLYKKELGNLIEPFDSNFVISEDSAHPPLFQMFLGGRISLETLCILLSVSRAKKYWDTKMEYDLVYQEIKLKIEKYTPFIQYDKEKLKKITIDFFT